MLKRYIDANEDGKELKTILKHGMKLSSALIKKLKVGKALYVNEQPVYTNYVCHAGDTIRADIAAVEPAQNIVPEYGDLNILYEDDILLAADKPAGMLTHPSRAQYTGSLAGYAAGYLSRGGSAACHALNRLDRGTSGIVLFAKSAYAKALCGSSMQCAEKIYLAVAYGRIPDERGVIDRPIKRLLDGNMLRGVAPDGARAVTHFERIGVLRVGAGAENGEKKIACKGVDMRADMEAATEAGAAELSLLRLRLETGRTHQIRVHCASLGYPIVGDPLYYSADSKAFSDRAGITNQLLHAERLLFSHPLTHESIDIKCPLTRSDMLTIIGPDHRSSQANHS